MRVRDAVPRVHSRKPPVRNALYRRHQRSCSPAGAASVRRGVLIHADIQSVPARVCGTFDDPVSAVTREKQMKKWNRDWKIRLIEEKNPDWSDLTPLLQ